MIARPASAGEHGLRDEEILSRAPGGGDTAVFEILTRRCNQLVSRCARTILQEGTEAEDLMQEAQVRGYQSLHQFAGRAAKVERSGLRDPRDRSWTITSRARSFPVPSAREVVFIPKPISLAPHPKFQE